MTKRILRYVRKIEREDIVQSSLSEIVMFVLFFILILLGSDAVTSTRGTPMLPELDICVAERQSCSEEASNLRSVRNNCESELDKCRGIVANRPPIFYLSETKGFSFKPADAELSEAFESNLTDLVIPKILEVAESQEVEITTIEIIGHTDENPLKLGNRSNLDRTLLDHIVLPENPDQNDARASKPEDLKPADNAGLGLARAISVRSYLMDDERMKDFEILVYSAAQTIDENGLAVTVKSEAAEVDNPGRRRIEIRMRGSASIYSPAAEPSSIRSQKIDL